MNCFRLAFVFASASIGAVESALGKDHPLVNDLHKIRGGMSHVSVTKKAATASKQPASGCCPGM